MIGIPCLDQVLPKYKHNRVTNQFSESISKEEARHIHFAILSEHSSVAQLLVYFSEQLNDMTIPDDMEKSYQVIFSELRKLYIKMYGEEMSE